MRTVKELADEAEQVRDWLVYLVKRYDKETSEEQKLLLALDIEREKKHIASLCEEFKELVRETIINSIQSEINKRSGV